MERIARTMAVAIAPAIAEGIGTRGSQAKPLFSTSSIVPTDGRPDEKRMGRYAAAVGGGRV
jgi:hypothetical protein